jgi:hypothetical protein
VVSYFRGFRQNFVRDSYFSHTSYTFCYLTSHPNNIRYMQNLVLFRVNLLLNCANIHTLPTDGQTSFRFSLYHTSFCSCNSMQCFRKEIIEKSVLSSLGHSLWIIYIILRFEGHRTIRCHILKGYSTLIWQAYFKFSEFSFLTDKSYLYLQNALLQKTATLKHVYFLCYIL